MAVTKVKLSQLPEAKDPTKFDAFVQDKTTGKSAKITAETLRGNVGPSAYDLWVKQPGNAGKTYEEYLAWNRQPATDAAASVSQLETQISQSEAGRVKAEEDRVEEEGFRDQAEKLRDDAEVERDRAEEARKKAAADMVEAECLRNTAEGNRNTAEGIRNTAEGERNTAEGLRDEAEKNREKQEGERQTNTAAAIQDADNATDRLNDLSDHRDYVDDLTGNWFKWNEETKEYEDTGVKGRGDVMYATFEVNKEGTLVMTTPDGYNGPSFSLEEGHLMVMINE